MGLPSIYKGLILFSILIAAHAGSTIYLTGVLRDQAPAAMSQCGGSPGEANGGKGFSDTDFQISGYQANEKGLCGPECNAANGWYPPACGQIAADRTPSYAYPGTSPGSNIQSPASFYKWFHDSNETRSIDFAVPLAQVGTSNSYTYVNDSFFPLDGQGWKDTCKNADGVEHNFAYCFESHSRFGFQGNEVFNFYGDDDVYVYIDDRLVIDLGSLHTKEQESVTLANIPGLKVGSSYRMDFFYCERHTTESNMEITTDLLFYCAYTDWCGVCEGNGQSCCTSSVLAQYCNDNTVCTVDTCSVTTPPSQPGGCVHTPITCPASPSACNISSCDPVKGCMFSAPNCDDGNKCTADSCDPVHGCQHTTISCNDNNLCTSDTCSITQGCQFNDITSTCNDNNACTTDSCSPSSGCSNTPVNCNNGNKCQTFSCDKTAGCQYATVACNDNNACTSDSCTPASGCQFQTVQCTTSNKCLSPSCDQSAGCQFANVSCDDSNKCTADSCATASGCINAPISCDDSNKCTTDSCTPAVGCQHVNITCNDNNMCTSDSCSASSGCVYTTISCDDSNACTLDTCAPATGCAHSNVSCDDSNKCTIDTCSPSSGCNHVTVQCDDGNACTTDSCDALQGCVYSNVTCNDNSMCTTDTCNPANGCVFSPVSCDDGKPCTIDTCSADNGCFHINLFDCSKCSNPLTVVNCTGFVTKCQTSECQPTDGTCKNTTISCDDNNVCTTDTCSPYTTGCNHTPISCDDSNPCTIDTCDRVNSCQHSNVTCNDSNVCTTDSCSSVDGSCLFAAISCDDGNACTIDTCDPVSGCASTPVNCDDGDSCTADSCATNGTCLHIQIAQYCSNCGNSSCTFTDPCNPTFCNTTTLTCQAAPVNCDDQNACTIDACTAQEGKGVCNYTSVICAQPDACSPRVCDKVKGCQIVPVICNDNNNCTVDSCDSSSGTANCNFVPVSCPTTDACNPASCDAQTGSCINTLVVCDDSNLCTTDSCSSVSGNATCLFDLLPCGDACNPGACDVTFGVCLYTPIICDDLNPCTDDAFYCNNSAPACNYTSNNMCEDNNVCTIDMCNSSAITGSPCVHTNITCTPNLCQTLAACDPVLGCQFENITCPGANDSCKISKCDLSAGCISENKICVVPDPGCYVSVCTGGACITSKRPDFSSAKSSLQAGVLCVLKYDKAVRDAAIGSGAVAGIVIGAVAAAALISFAGKKGYDFLAARSGGMGNTQSNPLYEQSGSGGENPLYS